MKNSQFTLIFALLITMAGLAQPASAQQTLAVSPSGGDDTANIQAAFNDAIVAGPGSVVELSSGQFYTNEIYVMGFSGSFTGYDQELTTVDVLRGLDPNAPAVGLSPDGIAVLFYFVNSTVAVSDLTFDISYPESAEPWRYVDEVQYSTHLTSVLQLSGTNDSRVQRATFRGHEGVLNPESPSGGWNVECGIGTGSNQSVLIDPNFTGNLTVTGNTIEHIHVGICVDAKDALVHITANNIDDSLIGIFNGGTNSVFQLSHNRIRRPYNWGIRVLQGRSPHQLLYWPIYEPSRWIISHNTIEENAETADGIGLEDWSRYAFGQKSIDVVVQHNTIKMDTIFGGIYAKWVEYGELLHNIVAGHMQLGIYLGAFDDCVPGWTLVGNNVQKVVPIPGYYPLIPPTPIYLGPGTSNTTVVGGSNQTNVVDLGQNNHLTGVNVNEGENLGEAVSEAQQERRAKVAAIKGVDPCQAP